MSNSVTEAVIRRDRNVVLMGLAAVISAATIYTINMARQFTGPATLLHAHTHGGHSLLTLFVMWTVMQVAMMSPTAVPMVLMQVKIERHRQPQHFSYVPTMLFFLGYIIIWAAFSLVFAALQMVLQTNLLLSPLMASSSSWLSAAVLIAAGLFQFSHLKQACLNQCRSPVTYFMSEWRQGRHGALLMGLKHGLHCVGCCWILMALLFVLGVMNLFWMAMITALVLVEKLSDRGVLYGRLAGIGLIGWGLVLLI